MRHEQLKKIETYEVVDPQPKRVQPEAAVPDVPSAIGVMMIAVYLVIVGLLALTIASAGQAPFMIAIDLAFLAAFFTVPAIFLKLERDPARRPGMPRFLSPGMQTYTGHVTGVGALVQMFIVPILLALGILCIGITVMVTA